MVVSATRVITVVMQKRLNEYENSSSTVLNVRFKYQNGYNGGTDVAAETKYALGWQGIETSELEQNRKQMRFYGLMWLQGL